MKIEEKVIVKTDNGEILLERNDDIRVLQEDIIEDMITSDIQPGYYIFNTYEYKFVNNTPFKTADDVLKIVRKVCNGEKVPLYFKILKVNDDRSYQKINVI